MSLLLAVSAAYAIVEEIEEQRLKDLLENVPGRIVREMPLEDKVGQLLHIGIRGRELSSSTQRLLQECRVGGVILFANNLGTPSEIGHLTGSLQKEAVASYGIPLLISTDQEGGRIRRVPRTGTTQFPSAMALGQTEDPRYAEEVGFITGYELGRLGINWVLAPVLDVNSNPRNPVINVRSFGSDPHLVGRMGVAYLKGNRAALSSAIIKHFPGHGDTAIDSHLELPILDKDLAALQQLELLPFQQAIAAGGEALMTAHILFRSLDETYPATLSKKILSQLLRQKMGYKGLISTDAMEMHAIAKHYSQPKAAYLAFEAGNDIILFTHEGPLIGKAYRALLKGFRSGRLKEEVLDQAVERQISLKYRRALFHRHALSSLKRYSADQEDRKLVEEHFNRLEERAKARYAALQQSYLTQGVDINSHISRAAVRSLRKPFPGLSSDELERVHLLVKTGPILLQAKRLRVASERIHPLRRCRDLLLPLRRDEGDIWILELPSNCIRTWNRLAQIQSRSKERRFQEKTIALYAGNPFLRILVPRSSYLLASFSDTDASQGALLFRSIEERQEVKEAKLILPPL